MVVGARGGSYLPGAPRHPVEHHTRYLSDFFQGHFSVPAPTVIVTEWANSLVDPSLAGRRSDHEQSLRDALEAARASAREHGRALGAAS